MTVVNKLEIYKDKGGEYRWRGRARNGRVVAESGEGYAEKRHAKRMARELHPEPSSSTSTSRPSRHLRPVSFETECRWKVRFRDKKAAKRHLRHLQTAFGGRFWAVYRCKFCLGWHAGHVPHHLRRP